MLPEFTGISKSISQDSLKPYPFLGANHCVLGFEQGAISTGCSLLRGIFTREEVTFLCGRLSIHASERLLLGLNVYCFRCSKGYLVILLPPSITKFSKELYSGKRTYPCEDGFLERWFAVCAFCLKEQLGKRGFCTQEQILVAFMKSGFFLS